MRLSSTTASRKQKLSRSKARLYLRAVVLGLSMPRHPASLLTFLLILGGSLFVAGSTSQAATPTSFSIESIGGQVGLGDTDLRQVVLNVIRWALGLLSLAAVSYMAYGGYVWLTAAGNEQRVEKAKQIILQAAIGMVIVLLAWAIVFFVARTFANTTTNGNTNTPGGGCINIDDCPPPPQGTFDVTAINTCASPPKSYENVPRSSAVSLTFNTDLQTAITAPSMNPPQTLTAAQDPVFIAVNAGDLQIQKCADPSCSSPSSPIDIDPNTTGVQGPRPVDNQVYTPGSTTAGTSAAPKAEWLAINNSLTFYHLSFSDVPAESRLFDPATTYQVRVPKETNNAALRDVRDRVLSYCRNNPQAVGNDIANCQDSSDGKYLEYTFTTSATDISGPAFTVRNTVPSSDYVTNTALQVDRNVPRSAILGIDFSAGLDPASVTTGNFRVYKITGVPDDLTKGTCGGGECPGTQIAANKYSIRVNAFGTGAWLQFTDPKEWYEPFTWYKVIVEDMRNLCGTAAPKHVWVFETNDVTPGVDFVYPANEFPAACPTTEVFAQFKTSMWNIKGGTSCQTYNDSSFQTKTMVYDTTVNAGVTIRTFGFSDQPPGGSTDPNKYCKRLGFDPKTAGLPVDHDYSIGLKADMVVNQNGDKLEYGDAVPGFSPASGTPPWHFTVKPADQCYQAPYISQVDPGNDSNGACISINGNYFEKVNQVDTKPNAPDPGDVLALSSAIQPDSTIKSWTNGSIVNKLDAGSLTPSPTGNYYNYRVTVDYPNPIGPLSTQPTVSSRFSLDAGAPTRPCLVSLNPNQGRPSNLFTAEGENFGSTSGIVATDNDSPWSVTGAWADKKITDIQVSANAQVRMSKVWIENSAGVPSNALPFNVLPPNPGPGPGTAPAVDESSTCNPPSQTPSPNPYKNDVSACLNSKVVVRFTQSLDPTTVTNTTAQLFECAGATCTKLIATSVQPAGNLVTLTLRKPLGSPIAKLKPSTTYEVVLSTGIKGTPPGPSFTPGTGTPMAAEYRWQFTTKAGNEDCLITNIGLNPNGNQTTNNPNYTPIILSALPMDASCHILSTAGLQYSWSSTNTAVGDLSPTPLAPTTDDIKTLSPPPTGAASGTTDVTVAVQSFTSPKFSLTYDPTACTDNGQCQQNKYGESCGLSVCDNGRCTPVINALDPAAGPIATWTTIKGCWFGGYDAARSEVKFFNNIDGVKPDPLQCGNDSWTNERIVREVPTGATTGQLTVKNSNNDVGVFAAGFSVNSGPLAPGLCKIVPTICPRNNPATLTGRGFSTQATGENVQFRKFGTTTDFPVTLYPSPPGWTDQQIAIRVPVLSAIGPNEVRVDKGSLTSNSLPCTVPIVPSNVCTTSCLFGAAGDAACAAVTPGTACSYPSGNGLGCCAAQPKIVSTNPLAGSTNNCRNTVAQITFDQPLDSQTVTTKSVTYQDGARLVTGAVATSTNASQGSISYYPGLLLKNVAQTMSLTPYTPDPASTIVVNNPSFETADSNGVPIQWGANKAKQSTDLPPGGGHGSFSVLADCSTCTGNNQAYIAENVANTNDNQASYRVTGWVKAEMTGGSAGLITRCGSGSGCKYDLGSINAPGIFTASGDWRYLDFVVTNSNNNPADISIDCFASAKAKVWCDDITVTKVVPGSTTIRGENGVLVDATGSPLSFTTGNNICAVDAISVAPTNDLFTALNETHNGFQAQAWPQNMSAPISPVAGTYEWSWSWSSEQSTIASVAMSSAATISPSDAAVTARANGSTTISATAAITKDNINNTTNRKVDGQSNVRVEFCVDPWQLPTSTQVGFEDSGLNCDLTAGGCQNFNFNLYYCRDTGATPLPNFEYTGPTPTSAPNSLGSIEGLNASDPTRLKSFFFKESATSRDTIGLLIFKNDDFLSPTDWFTKRFPLDTGASSTVIAGYPAVKSGTTTYIGVTDYNGSALQGLMFVFDYNSNNAAPETVKIANQMLENMIFNNQSIISGQKAALIRDTKRRQDLTSLQLSLAAYKAKNGSYPALTSGSYITGFTTSKWPSWQETLGTDLGKSMPLDPANTFATQCTTPYEAATCWAESTKTFACPANSQIYGYRNASNAVDVYATMEYQGPGSFISGTAPSGLCTPPNTCDCFNYVLRIAQ